MALTINTNVSSLYAQQYLAQNSSKLSSTLQRLSSGLRINNAADDPAGLAIAVSMQADVNGVNQGSRNAQDGVNLVLTAQGAMQTIISDLQTMNQLAVQAANETNGTAALANIDTQYQALLNEIERVTQSTQFNNVNILTGGSLSIQIGAGNTANDKITITLTNTSTGSAGINIAGTDLTSNSNASTAIGSLKAALQSMTTGLATLGANSANLAAAINSNNTYATSLSASQSSIMDADYAAESSNMAKYSILNQSSIAMLAQANSIPQMVLQLLRG